MATTATIDCAPARQEEARALSEHGFFIRERFFAAAEIDAVEVAADAAIAWRNDNFERYHDLFAQISTRDGFVFVNELFDDSTAAAALRAFCLRPAVRDMARTLGGPDVAHCCYQLVYKFAGHNRAFAWHQDEVHTPSDPPFFNMWIALSDMDLDNGCLWTKPGVALDRVLPHAQTQEGLLAWPLDHPDQGVPLRMRRGDICLMGSKALHKSGPNRSARTRKAMLIVFMDRNAHIRGQTVPTIAYD
ncbi:MAG TPA: phytanoyl-CoA dioxygenase family protein [Acetobacteraceae bacterium]|jgi:ectoine hydroxylase-related dioxygenase (phytanoyl-CoA dioxygenase family)|nr:phytanoyl-CoA dioxygenase family protein [Acetobacteraceae bacterium]